MVVGFPASEGKHTWQRNETGGTKFARGKMKGGEITELGKRGKEERGEHRGGSEEPRGRPVAPTLIKNQERDGKRQGISVMAPASP